MEFSRKERHVVVRVLLAFILAYSECNYLFGDCNKANTWISRGVVSACCPTSKRCAIGKESRAEMKSKSSLTSLCHLCCPRCRILFIPPFFLSCLFLALSGVHSSNGPIRRRQVNTPRHIGRQAQDRHCHRDAQHALVHKPQAHTQTTRTSTGTSAAAAADSCTRQYDATHWPIR